MLQGAPCARVACISDRRLLPADRRAITVLRSLSVYFTYKMSQVALVEFRGIFLSASRAQPAGGGWRWRERQRPTGARAPDDDPNRLRDAPRPGARAAGRSPAPAALRARDGPPRSVCAAAVLCRHERATANGRHTTIRSPMTTRYVKMHVPTKDTPTQRAPACTRPRTLPPRATARCQAARARKSGPRRWQRASLSDHATRRSPQARAHLPPV